jgi:hypothetical protein
VAIRYPMTKDGGSVVDVAEADVAAYEAQGYRQAMAAYEDTAPSPSWRDGARYNIAHADGRRYAVTYTAWLRWYQPLGFALGALEDRTAPPRPAAPAVASRADGATRYLRLTFAAWPPDAAGLAVTLTRVPGGAITPLAAAAPPPVAVSAATAAGGPGVRVALARDFAPHEQLAGVVATLVNVATSAVTVKEATLP